MGCIFAAHIKEKQIIPLASIGVQTLSRNAALICVSLCLRVLALDRVHILCSQNTQTTAFSLEIIWACRQKGFNSVSAVIYFFPRLSLSLVFSSKSLLSKCPCLSWSVSLDVLLTFLACLSLSLNGLAKGVCKQRCISQTSLILMYSYPSVCLSS